MRKWTKTLFALGAAVLMSMSGISAMAAPTVMDKAPTELGEAYFKTLKGQDGNTLTGTPSLTISKYEYGTDGEADIQKPLQNVKFKYAKVGGVYQYNNEILYGINTDVATKAEIADSADYTSTGATAMSYYKDYNTIQNAVQGSESSEYDSGITSVTLSENSTDKDGKISVANATYGLYLIIESDVSGAQDAQGKPVAISKSQHPFIAAVPYYVEGEGTNGYWVEAVDAKVKNSTTVAEIEKKIIEENEYDAAAGTETGVDTDTADINDTVYFHLKSIVPPLATGDEDIKKYVITDQISQGLTLNTNSIKVVTYVQDGTATVVDNSNSSNYTVSEPTAISQTNETEFTGGKEFSVTFTDVGLSMLSNLVKEQDNQGKDVYVVVYLSADVNTNAVIGPQAQGAANNSGNPNKVKLTYKVGGGAEMETPWDKVTAFTFGIDVAKQLDGKTPDQSADLSDIQFILYQKVDDTTTKYYTFAENPANGTYIPKAGDPTVTTENEATKMTPSTEGKFYVKGLDEGTYYLKEVATKDGYNLLAEPIEIKLTAKKGANTFVDVSSNDDFLGTLENDPSETTGDTNGKTSLTVNNTSGFVLPATGGIGGAIFAAIGVLVAALGGVFCVILMKKSKKNA